jgi:hypothetical protein
VQLRRSFSRVPFLGAGFRLAFGGLDNLDTISATLLGPQIDRYRQIPRHWLVSQAGLKGGKKTAILNRLLARLYRAILAVSGAKFVLDSSKDAPYAYVLAANAELDVKLLQLVRDSRAVAFLGSGDGCVQR